MKISVGEDGLPFSSDPSQLIGQKEAAVIFGVSPVTIHRWRSHGILRTVRMPNGRIRYSRVWCEAYMERERNSA